MNPLKTRGGQPMAFVGFGIWLGGNDLWVLSPEIPVVANHPKSSTCAVQANLP